MLSPSTPVHAATLLLQPARRAERSEPGATRPPPYSARPLPLNTRPCLSDRDCRPATACPGAQVEAYARPAPNPACLRWAEPRGAARQPPGSPKPARQNRRARASGPSPPVQDPVSPPKTRPLDRASGRSPSRSPVPPTSPLLLLKPDPKGGLPLRELRRRSPGQLALDLQPPPTVHQPPLWPPPPRRESRSRGRQALALSPVPLQPLLERPPAGKRPAATGLGDPPLPRCSAANFRAPLPSEPLRSRCTLASIVGP